MGFSLRVPYAGPGFLESGTSDSDNLLRFIPTFLKSTVKPEVLLNSVYEIITVFIQITVIYFRKYFTQTGRARGRRYDSWDL